MEGTILNINNTVRNLYKCENTVQNVQFPYNNTEAFIYVLTDFLKLLLLLG